MPGFVIDSLQKWVEGWKDFHAQLSFHRANSYTVLAD